MIRRVLNRQLMRLIGVFYLIAFSTGLATALFVQEARAESLRITLQEAVLMALDNNRSLKVERLRPEIQQLSEEEALAAFDLVVTSEASIQFAESTRPTSTRVVNSDSDTYHGEVSLKKFFPSGTFVTVGFDGEIEDSTSYGETFSTAGLGLTVTRSLLRGKGEEVNLIQLRKAQIDTDISSYELRAVTENLIARVETTYWEHALAKRQIEIFEESLKVSKRQLAETHEMIAVGSLAEAELAAVQAEVAIQQQGLINARSRLAARRLQLLRLLSPPGEGLWDRELVLIHEPKLPEIQLDTIDNHVQSALRMRPELNQTKLEIKKGDLEIVRTKNGMLPKLDLFITLGKTGYSESFFDALGGIPEDGYVVKGGLKLEYPVDNRRAKAQNQRAVLRREQTVKALDNLSQLVELDVRDAFIEVNRTRDQIDASTATRRFQEEKYRIETEKFRVGRSTNFSVAQAQRDLLASRISEVQAVVNYLQALIRFYRLEGSLLERRGIDLKL